MLLLDEARPCRLAKPAWRQPQQCLVLEQKVKNIQQPALLFFTGEGFGKSAKERPAFCMDCLFENQGSDLCDELF